MRHGWALTTSAALLAAAAALPAAANGAAVVAGAGAEIGAGQPELPPELPGGIDPGVLEIAGDTEYGEYLASECASCHRAGGAEQGIPQIHGLPRHELVIALHSYREGLRRHPGMEMIARRLGDQEIAALAAWFAQAD
ncbi:MAG: c-type cytochrome [Gemmobacter sp.]